MLFRSRIFLLFISIGCAAGAPDGSSPRACGRLSNSRVQAENVFECLISLRVLIFSFGLLDLKRASLADVIAESPTSALQLTGRVVVGPGFDWAVSYEMTARRATPETPPRFSRVVDRWLANLAPRVGQEIVRSYCSGFDGHD